MCLQGEKAQTGPSGRSQHPDGGGVIADLEWTVCALCDITNGWSPEACEEAGKRHRGLLTEGWRNLLLLLEMLDGDLCRASDLWSNKAS